MVTCFQKGLWCRRPPVKGTLPSARTCTVDVDVESVFFEKSSARKICCINTQLPHETASFLTAVELAFLFPLHLTELSPTNVLLTRRLCVGEYLRDLPPFS